VPRQAAVQQRQQQQPPSGCCSDTDGWLLPVSLCFPAGLEALVKSDKRFSPFAESLFSRLAVNTSREQLTAEENDVLNTKLAAFLRVLTNHFLAAAAFQVLELCIRCYK
jgi:hypothetical protein